MPKRVDHQARRRQIAEALLRVAAEHGLEAVSLRHVAAAAGVTSGMVQHYFRTKDEMMTFALETVGERIRARMSAAVSALGDTPEPRALLRALLGQLLPLDDARREEGRIALAFYAYAAVRPEIAAARRRGSERLRGFLSDQLHDAHAAAALLALVEGLNLQVLGEQYPSDAALAAFDHCLDILLSAGPPA